MEFPHHLFNALTAINIELLNESKLTVCSVRRDNAALDTDIGEIRFLDNGGETWCVRVVLFNGQLNIELRSPTNRITDCAIRVGCNSTGLIRATFAELLIAQIEDIRA